MTSETDTYVSNIVFEKKPKSKDEQIIMAWNNGLKYIMSLDAGTTWKQKTLPAAIGNTLSLAAVAEGVIYIIMNQYSLYKSTDLGVTWNELDLQTYTGLQALSIYDKNNFTLNAYYNIVSSTDGGNTFIKGPSGYSLRVERNYYIKTWFYYWCRVLLYRYFPKRNVFQNYGFWVLLAYN